MSYEDENSFLRDPVLKTPVEPFTFDKTQYSLKHFTQHFAHHLPVVAMVTGGFCSPDEGKFTFSDDEVYWIACIKKQKRLLAKDESGLNVSIPYDHSMKFRVKEMSGEESGPFKMDKILEMFTDSAVDNIHPTKATEVTVFQGAENMFTLKLKTLEPIDVYEETYLVGNPVLMKHLANYQIAIPVFLPIRLRVADGLENNTKHEAFGAEMARLQRFTRPFPNRPAKGNPEIMIFTDEQVDSVQGNYQYIDPYAPASSVPQLGPDGYESVDREFKWTAVFSRRSLPPLPESDDEYEKSESESKSENNNKNGGSQQTKQAALRKTAEKYEDINIGGSRKPSLNIYTELPNILKPQPSIKQRRTGIERPKLQLKPELKKEAILQTKQEQEPIPKQEPKPQPGTQPKPHPKGEPKSEPKPQPETQPKPHPKEEPKSEPKPQPETQPKPQPKEEPKSEPKPQPETHPKPEPKEESKSEPKPQPDIQPKPNAKEEPKSEPKPQPISAGAVDESDHANAEEDDYACASEMANVYAEIGDVPTNIDFLGASVREVGSYLRLLKLHKYIEPFRVQDIDGVMLLEVDKEILMTDFNFSAIEARKLCKFVHDGWRPKL